MLWIPNTVPFYLENFYVLQGGQPATRGRCHGVAWTVTGNGKLGPRHPHTGRTWAGKLVILFLSWMQCCGIRYILVRILILILLFSSVTFKWQQKLFLLITSSSWSYIFIIFQSVAEQQEIKVFLTTFCLTIEGSGSAPLPLINGFGCWSWRPKIIRIQIRNSAWKVNFWRISLCVFNCT